MALGSIQRLTEMSTRDIFWRVKAAGAGADDLEILRASASWNPQGLPRCVQGLLYLTQIFITKTITFVSLKVLRVSTRLFHRQTGKIYERRLLRSLQFSSSQYVTAL